MEFLIVMIFGFICLLLVVLFRLVIVQSEKDLNGASDYTLNNLKRWVKKLEHADKDIDPFKDVQAFSKDFPISTFFSQTSYKIPVDAFESKMKKKKKAQK